MMTIKMAFGLTILFVSTIACPSTETAIQCFYDKADMNHDNKITKKELENAIYARLSWIESSAFTIFGGIDRILHDCDQNKDNILTIQEAGLMHKTCMNSCFKRTKTMSLFECS